jgi:ribosome-associated heat shock protein Hsp15
MRNHQVEVVCELSSSAISRGAYSEVNSGDGKGVVFTAPFFEKKMADILETVRIDKWLWAARFFKSRAQAVLAIEAGRVHLHGERVKPARTVKVGDRLLIQREQERFELWVRAVTETRRSAPLARMLFDETPESLLARETAAEKRRYFVEPSQDIKARPTKRDRRDLEKWRDV